MLTIDAQQESQQLQWQDDVAIGYWSVLDGDECQAGQHACFDCCEWVDQLHPVDAGRESNRTICGIKYVCVECRFGEMAKTFAGRAKSKHAKPNRVASSEEMYDEALRSVLLVRKLESEGVL